MSTPSLDNRASTSTPTFSFHAMAKPSGADCNLDCDYCFYLEKASLYREQRRHRMGQDVLENYVRNYIESHPTHSEVAFTWQGGEPTLMGLAFTEKRSSCRHVTGKVVRSAIASKPMAC